MAKKKTLDNESAELRRRAEAHLGAATPVNEEDRQKLQHELQVHQIELELQNAELRQSRDDLETALDKFTDLYDFAPVGYFTLDRKGTITSVNLTGAGLVGIERSRLIGQGLGNFVTDATRPAYAAFLENLFTNPTKLACEVTLKKAGNAPLSAQIEGLATTAQECRIAVIDVTERKRTEESLRLAKSTAETLRLAKESDAVTARLKSQFLANMGHELRTPLAIVFGMFDVLLLGNLDTEQREYVNTAQKSARSLLRILNDMLLMAKSEAGALVLEEAPFSLQECLTQAVDIVTAEAHRKNLDLALQVAREVPDVVVGDQGKVRQVLFNLIGNAVKFTEEGKIVVRVTTERAHAGGKQEVTFTVTDTGIGIPEDKKDLLFRAFSQVDASSSRKFGGAGLGLVISKEIVNLLGGTISFVSEEGKGSTFSFTIPLMEAELR